MQLNFAWVKFSPLASPLQLLVHTNIGPYQKKVASRSQLKSFPLFFKNSDSVMEKLGLKKVRYLVSKKFVRVEKSWIHFSFLNLGFGLIQSWSGKKCQICLIEI